MPTATAYRDVVVDRDRISDTILLGASRSEHSAQSEVLDMQEAAGSSPAPPTTRHFTLKLTA